MKTKEKEIFKNALPSIEDAQLFSEKKRDPGVFAIRELEIEIVEKYNGKIDTIVDYEIIDCDRFSCTLRIGFERFNNHWFHLFSFVKSVDKNSSVVFYAFPERVVIKAAADIEEIEDIIKRVLSDERTKVLMLSNL